MKKKYPFLIILILFLVGTLIQNIIIENNYERAKEICKVYVCNVTEDVEIDSEVYLEKDFYYLENGLCTCFNYRESWKHVVVHPFTGDITNVTYEE